jgi:hypothetical protein
MLTIESSISGKPSKKLNQYLDPLRPCRPAISIKRLCPIWKASRKFKQIEEPAISSHAIGHLSFAIVSCYLVYLGNKLKLPCNHLKVVMISRIIYFAYRILSSENFGKRGVITIPCPCFIVSLWLLKKCYLVHMTDALPFCLSLGNYLYAVEE